MESDQTSHVVIHTANYIIEGNIALVPGARLTDFIREDNDFIAITQVTVKGLDGNVRFEIPFMDLRRMAIEIAYPKPTN